MAKHIQAHGGGILKFGDTYYWFGEDRGTKSRLAQSPRQLLCLDEFRGLEILRRRFKHGRDRTNFGRGLVLERPKVFYNAPTKKFVMYFHMDDGRYQVASVGVAVSDTVDGDYTIPEIFPSAGPRKPRHRTVRG